MFAGPAKRYFNYMGKALPVLCASGICPYIPAARKAMAHMDRLDDFSPRAMDRNHEELKGFLSAFEKRAARTIGPENALYNALADNVRGVLLELFSVRPWQTSPQLYPLVAFTGLYHALTLPMDSTRKRQKSVRKRLRAIPGLLAQVQDNIETVTPLDRGAAQTMTRRCARYLQTISTNEAVAQDKAAASMLDACMKALRNYDRHVISRPLVEEHSGPDLEAVLQQGFSGERTVDEVFEMADRLWQQSLFSLKAMAAEHGIADWLEAGIAHAGPEGLRPCGNDENQQAAQERVFKTLATECENLSATYRNMPGNNHAPDIPLSVRIAPAFMAGTVQDILYCPPPAPSKKNRALLLVVPEAFTAASASENMRREARITMACETWPGRHVLACHRLASDNGLLSQLRNPLLEAGWSAHAEDMIANGNYLESPGERIVLGQRRLRRAARCIVDTGLATGHADQNRCVALLEQCGMEKKQALQEIRDIRTRPGSQVAPVLGLCLIRKMQEESNLSSGDFRAAMLTDGGVSMEMTRMRIRANAS
jgi:uncharacterized protein (DUF885 family)